MIEGNSSFSIIQKSPWRLQRNQGCVFSDKMVRIRAISFFDWPFSFQLLRVFFNRRQMILIESATTPHSFNSLLLPLLPHIRNLEMFFRDTKDLFNFLPIYYTDSFHLYWKKVDHFRQKSRQILFKFCLKISQPFLPLAWCPSYSNLAHSVETPTLRIPLKLQPKPQVLGFFDITHVQMIY